MSSGATEVQGHWITGHWGAGAQETRLEAGEVLLTVASAPRARGCPPDLAYICPVPSTWVPGGELVLLPKKPREVVKSVGSRARGPEFKFHLCL